MSWYSKVAWAEGLFLRPHHLQQSDRYLEHLLQSRVRQITPYPWGFSELEIDRDLAQQSKFAVRRAAGVMPDGTPFDMPADSPLPEPLDIPDGAAGQLDLAVDAGGRAEYPRGGRGVVGKREPLYPRRGDLHRLHVGAADRGRDRYRLSTARVRTPPHREAGFVSVGIARVVEIRDKTIVFDEKYAPPLLTCSAHPVVNGWTDRVVGWIDNKLEELARYAADPTAGGGLQSVDYFRPSTAQPPYVNVLKHFRASTTFTPSACMRNCCGSWANSRPSRRRSGGRGKYPQYDHDNLEDTFGPVIRDLQDFLSARLGRRAIRLEIIERAQNAFVSTIRDRSLFRTATFVPGSLGAAAADRDPEPVSAVVQGRPEHQDERDRPCPSTGRDPRSSADPAAPDPGDYRSRLLLP